MLTWFDNPPRRRVKSKAKRRSSRRPPKGFKTWSSWSKSMRARKKGGSKMARRKRKKLYGAAAKAHSKARRRGGSSRKRSRARPRAAARRRKASWRRTTRSHASRAGRALRYRRTNPPFKGIVGQLVSGAQDAAWIVGGKAASRIIAGFIPIGAGGVAVNLAVQAGAALAAGYVGRFISPNASRMMLAGGLSGVIETFVKQMNIPYISSALGDDAYAVGSYPMAALPGVSSYPQILAGAGVAGYDDDEAYLYQ